MCNLQCNYCFYHNETKKREIESYGFMSEETLEKVIQKALDYSNNMCSFTYQGGEPLLRGLDFFQKSVELQKKYNVKGVNILNAIQTNGTCLDEKWAKFLKKIIFWSEFHLMVLRLPMTVSGLTPKEKEASGR